MFARYVISCKADDYNQAEEKQDRKKTINGHQFVMVRIGSEWVAINTSKGESTSMTEGFSPDSCMPPRNISMEFESYPGVVFLIRKIGTDYNDDCGDNSLTALMNISPSGDSQNAEFLWERPVSKYRSAQIGARNHIRHSRMLLAGIQTRAAAGLLCGWIPAKSMRE